MLVGQFKLCSGHTVKLGNIQSRVTCSAWMIGHGSCMVNAIYDQHLSPKDGRMAFTTKRLVGRWKPLSEWKCRGLWTISQDAATLCLIPVQGEGENGARLFRRLSPIYLRFLYSLLNCLVIYLNSVNSFKARDIYIKFAYNLHISIYRQSE